MLFKKTGFTHFILFLVAVAFFFACGDDTTEIVSQTSRSYIEIVDEESDLPECTEDNEGEQVLVKGESYARTCIDGDWTSAIVAGKDTAYLKGDKVVCATKELDDKSGVKVICNGDSVGVLLNGSQGAEGEKGGAGTSCSIVGVDSISVRLYCGADSMTVYLGVKPDTTSPVIEPPKVVVSLDSLTGFAQKGPFLKGGKVTLYELRDSVTLEKTGRSYVGEVLNDSGYYKIPNVELSCRYAIITAKGFYLSETSVQNPDEPVELNALVDLLSWKTANVNLFTHFEAERVKNLVLHKKMGVQSAKHQARNEILNQFHADTVKINTPFESMNILDSNDASAFLVAVSIIVKDNGNAEPLSKILPEISNDMFWNGEWGNLEHRANVSDRIFFMDMLGVLSQFRGFMEYWNIPMSVPDYEKYLRAFWSIENGLGVCGSDSVPIGTVKHVSNRYSSFYAKSYTDTTSRGGKHRFICSNAGVSKWFFALDIEKDTVGLDFKNNKTGVTVVGVISGRQILWDDDNLRYATEDEEDVSWGCISELQNKCVGKTDEKKRKCVDNRLGSKDCFTDARDSTIYEFVKIGTQVWMAENLRYADSVNTPSLKGKMWCYDNDATNCEKYGVLYRWAAAIDSIRLATNADNPQVCGYDRTCTIPDKWQGICPSGWHLPTLQEQEILVETVGGEDVAGTNLKSKQGWSNGGNGTDKFGFSALPAGWYKNPNSSVYLVDNDSFVLLDSATVFWSVSDAEDKPTSCVRDYRFDYYLKNARLINSEKGRVGNSIRCLKD